jgi:hypothetical protein
MHDTTRAAPMCRYLTRTVRTEQTRRRGDPQDHRLRRRCLSLLSVEDIEKRLACVTERIGE